MQGQTERTWRSLCELAIIEKDPEKLLILMEEINEILLEKENRLQHIRGAAAPGR